MSMYHLFVILWPHSLPHTPSSHVLLMPNSKHLTHGISNLVSLITKTKLGLSDFHSDSIRPPTQQEHSNRHSDTTTYKLNIVIGHLLLFNSQSETKALYNHQEDDNS
jgi:hypothetical protein